MVRTVEKRQNGVNHRLVFMAVFLSLLFVIVIYRLFFLQIVKGEDYKLQAEDQYTFFSRTEPNRGDIKILDKGTPGGHIVATTVKKPLVYAVGREIKDPNATAEKLSKILGISVEEILPKLVDKERLYVQIKKNLNEQEEQEVKDAKLSGIHFDYEKLRLYPEGSFLAQVIGFVGYKDKDRIGLYGLERQYEGVLKGSAGSLSGSRSVAGGWIFGSDNKNIPAQNGDTLILTIDRAIQHKVETVLKTTIEHHQADSGSIIVMDPKTGAILAMATAPSFDLNKYNEVGDLGIYLNQATQTAYEPGSVFKAFTMAAALNEGKVTPDTTYTDTGKVEIDDYVIQNSDKEAHGIQTMTQVLEESLNTGVIFAKDKIGNPTFLKYVKDFGFGQVTGIELPEGKGNLDNLRANIKVNFHTASFGQGLSVTPIQLVAAYGALANKGALMKPYIVASKVNQEGKIETTQPTEVRKVITESAATDISKMLVNVVDNGHGQKAGVPGYFVAGKTGTAQVPKSDGRGYEENNNIGSFAGYAPADDPKFVMLVRVNHPRTVKFAESTAAPAFGEIAQFLLNYYNIPPTREIKK